MSRVTKQKGVWHVGDQSYPSSNSPWSAFDARNASGYRIFEKDHFRFPPTSSRDVLGNSTWN